MKPRAGNASRTIIGAVLGFGVFAAVVSGALFLMPPRLGGDSTMALAIPGTGNVRVVTTAVETGSAKRHYKWSLIGSSNWRKATVTDAGFALADTYPLNDATTRGGCNVYEADLVADQGLGRWEVTLHGSDGTTVRSSGGLPPGKPLTDTVRVLQTAPSASVGTPGTLSLAEVAGKTIRISVAR